MNLFRRKSRTTHDGSAKILAVGTPAPDFALPDGHGQPWSLREFREQPVILVFYPEDHSPVCTDQLALYNEVLPIFEEYRAQVLGISVDSVQAHRDFAQERKLNFPLLSDSQPRGEVAARYGVYDTESGKSRRALFVIDREGIVQWSHLSPWGVNPGADGILRALDSLKEEVAL